MPGPDRISVGVGVPNSPRIALSPTDVRRAFRGLGMYLGRHFPEAPVRGPGTLEGDKVWPLTKVSGRHIGGKDQVDFAVSEAQTKVWRSVPSKS